MFRMMNLLVVPILFACLFAFSGCEKKDSLGDKLEETGEKIEERADDAGDNVKDAVEDTGDEIEDATDH